MTTIIKTNQFASIYSQQFEAGKIDFDNMSSFFLRSIKELKEQKTQLDTDLNKYSKNPSAVTKINTTLEGIKEEIGVKKTILRTAIDAQKDYLDNTRLGRIERLFQYILGLCGIKSSLEIANEGIESLSSDDNITSKAEIEMARFIAINDGKNCCFKLGANRSDPSTILIAKPNGDVYEISREKKPIASGGSREYQIGKLHGISKNKERGILGNIEVRKKDSSEKGKYLLKTINNEMKVEYSILQDIKSVKRVTKAYDCFTISLGDVDACFTIVKHNDMALQDFIHSDKFGLMSTKEKKSFILSLLNTYKGLHENGIIHRDVKIENIVVRKNKKNQWIPTVIDLGGCVSSDNKSNKQSINDTTPPYWPPEYADALLKDPLNCTNNRFIGEATTSKMDTWSLGLVFFQFFYGKDFIGEVLGFNYCNFGKPSTQAGNLKQILAEDLPQFIKAMGSGIIPQEKPESWDELQRKIEASPFIWNTIILPMLNVDPKQRPSMETLHDQLERHIGLS